MITYIDKEEGHNINKYIIHTEKSHHWHVIPFNVQQMEMASEFSWKPEEAEAPQSTL
jgi:hypothetical protein